MAAQDSNPSTQTASHSTLAQVHQVRSILLTRLPYELTDVILTQAQYFARLSTKRTSHLRVQASNELFYNAKWIYMVSEPVPSLIYGDDDDDGIRSRPTKVRSVKFVVTSCDQGWGGFSEDRNTYRNSYTWFEASILRPSSSTLPSPQWLTSLSAHPINYNFDFSSSTSASSSPSSPITSSPSSPTISSLPTPASAEPTECTTDTTYTELLRPYKHKSKRWLIQMNAQASRHIRSHTITWSRTSPTTGNTDINTDNNSISQTQVEYDDKIGSGRGLGFVESLQAGDRIAVVARALYPGWENNVYEVEIEIAYQT